MNAFESRATALPKRIHVEDLLASVHRLHPNVVRSNLLIPFCSDLKNHPKPDDKNNDAPNYALFRLKPENRVAQFLRVSRKFQPL